MAEKILFSVLGVVLVVFGVVLLWVASRVSFSAVIVPVIFVFCGLWVLLSRLFTSGRED